MREEEEEEEEGPASDLLAHDFRGLNAYFHL